MSVQLHQCLWIRSASTDRQPYFPPLVEALKKRGTEMLFIRGPGDAETLEKIKERAWNSDVHVVIDAMLSWELKLLRPIFEPRRNYSVAMMDWWTSDFWIKKNASYLLFRNYNGIAARLGLRGFAEGRRVPLFTWPEKLIRLHVGGALLRLPLLLARPFIDARKAAQRREDSQDPKRLIYFPFTIVPELVPLKDEPFEHDFTNASSTLGLWLMRDAYAPARFNFANMYADRQRLTNLALRCGPKVKVFDLRRHPGHLPWEQYCQVLRRSRFGIATGGLHQASLPKHLEQVCLGTPVLGEDLPFEYPWLKQCLFEIDALHVPADDFAEWLRAALDQHAKLRAGCLDVRERLLRMYSPDRILDLAQEQIDGKGIVPGYLKPGAKDPCTVESS